MHFDIRNKYRVYIRQLISIRKLESRKGVCSKNLETDKHILLWDFDDDNLGLIASELHEIQRIYKLPKIYIFQSSAGHYHAYSFCSRLFREIVHILSATKTIDIEYLRLGMIRGYYTLRFTPKKGEKIHRIGEIDSIYPNEMSPDSVTINEYFTTNI